MGAIAHLEFKRHLCDFKGCPLRTVGDFFGILRRAEEKQNPQKKGPILPVLKKEFHQSLTGGNP
ncbi:MAG: hypothetical protein QMC89_02795 [Candidatus Hodarchaeaceae archaeon]|nr:hypothetical protein [Candidatus Hodarchaeaceae archaeon]